MFATLVGTDKDGQKQVGLFDRLCQLATGQGFARPVRDLPVQPDQTPLSRWNLEYKGPPEGPADFFLAVTAPRVPGISPIPAKKTVDGPLFAVVVMDSFYGVWHGGDFKEFREEADVVGSFERFLTSLPKART